MEASGLRSEEIARITQYLETAEKQVDRIESILSDSELDLLAATRNSEPPVQGSGAFEDAVTAAEITAWLDRIKSNRMETQALLTPVAVSEIPAHPLILQFDQCRAATHRDTRTGDP